MKVRFTLEALEHIGGIRSYVGANSLPAALRIVDRIFAEADRLSEFARLGRRGQVSGTSEWTVPGLPYVIVYEIAQSRHIVVLGVFHGAQDR
jgi:toxin ParE1/3/4